MMEVPKELWDYRTSLSGLCCALEDVEDVLSKQPTFADQSQDDLLSSLRSYLHSESQEIITEGKKISAVCANNTRPAIMAVEASLVTSMTAATNYLQRQMLDPHDDSKFRTMDLSLSLNDLRAEGDVDTSRREVTEHFSAIKDAQTCMFKAILNTPILPRGTNSLALTNLEMAFSKNMQDPFWLVKGEHEPFPDLISLSWPSPNPDEDLVTNVMKRCCKKWVEKGDELDLLTQRTLEGVKSSFCKANAALADLPIEAGNLQCPINNIVSKITEVKGFIDMQEKKKPPRVAVVGCMSHGKSSFLNSLIGSQLVISEGKYM